MPIVREAAGPGHPRLGSRFWRLWSAATVSAAGDGLRGAIFPLLAAADTHDPRTVALVTVAACAPWPLFGLVGGAVADRVDRRTAMWVIDAARGAVMAGFAVVVATRGVSIVGLCVLAFVLGSAQTVFDTAATALLPTVLPRAGLARGNARLMTSQALAVEFIGPPLGGVLFAVAPPLPPALDAATFLAAAALVATLARTGTAPEPTVPAAPPSRPGPSAAEPTRPGVIADIGEGLRWLAHQPFLRVLTTVAAVLGAISGALLAVLVLYARDVLGLRGAGYGLLVGCYGAGSITGALLCPPLLRRRPGGHLLTAALLVAVAVLTALAATTRPLVAAGALAVFGVAGGVWSVTDASLWQALVPNAMLGRVSGVYRTTALTSMTLGAALAGVTAHAVGIPTTLLGCAALTALLVATLGRRLATTPTRSATSDTGH